MTAAEHPHAHDTHRRLAALPASCDPDFDDAGDELERQLAEIRLALDHI